MGFLVGDLVLIQLEDIIILKEYSHQGLPHEAPFFAFFTLAAALGRLFTVQAYLEIGDFI